MKCKTACKTNSTDVNVHIKFEAIIPQIQPHKFESK